MASYSCVCVTTQIHPLYAVPDTSVLSSDKVTALLQENHDKHHIFFNPNGFHNHIVHHLLSLYSLGAPPHAIETLYTEHKKSQRSVGPLDPAIVDALHDSQKFKSYLNKEGQYHNYLEFFRREIGAKGYEAVVVQYLLARNDQADDLLTRCYAGFLHPLIHLGFGLEFQQPAIIAEALAQAALHSDYLAPFFLGAEKKAAATQPSLQASRSLHDLLDEIRCDTKLATAAHWDDDNKIRDGVLVRAPEEMMQIAMQWTVLPEDLALKTAEMIDAVVCYTMGAQHPPKQFKIDFYFMHCVNCSIFFSSILQLPWLSQWDKVRLLEWKGRNDLVMYASRRAPKTLTEEFHTYQPKQPGPWESLFERVANLPEDGHACKMLRALAHGQNACRPFQDRLEFRIKDDMWLTFGHMLMDSVEDTGRTWVRSAGFDEAWQNFGNRIRLQG